MNECLMVYCIFSGIVSAIIFPLIYLENLCDFWDGDLLETFFVGVLGLILGWLIFPIILLIGFISVMDRLFKGKKQ